MGASAVAQPDYYAVIEAAAARSVSEPRFILDVGGSETTGNRTERFQLRLFVENGKVSAEQIVDGRQRLLIIADGTKVWRYDPVANEYTFINQPDTLRKTLSLAAGWSRSQLQRPLRLAALSVRWLVAPSFEPGENWIRVYQTRNEPNWRGTDMSFRFDERQRLDRFVIEDRHDTLAGFKQVTMEGLFAFPNSMNVSFSFTPPAGAKPAADLPPRPPSGGG